MSLAPEYAAMRLPGFNIIDCDVMDRERLYFLAREDYTQRPGWRDSREPPAEGRLAKRLLVVRPSGPPEKMWGHMHLTGLDQCVGAVAFAPDTNYVVVDSNSKAWSKPASGNGFEKAMKSLYEGGLLRGGVQRARSFGGELFCRAGGRGLFERTAPATWQPVGPVIPYVYASETIGHFGFEDFDRFNETDWYAVGGLSDVWHFDGTAWRQCAFPSNQGLFAVCCAGDGAAYISVGAGSIYRGKGDRWNRIHDGQMSLPIKDLVWYEGQVWGTSDYGLWTIRDGVLQEADVPSDVKICAGNLATRDGVLLVAGYGGAAFKRDGEWTVVFHDHEVRELATKTK